MTPAADLATVTPQTDAADALALLARRGVNQLPVVEDDRVIGLIRREDILRWLSIHGGEDLGAEASVIAAGQAGRPSGSEKRPRRV
jgi:CBS domain-containing protein